MRGTLNYLGIAKYTLTLVHGLDWDIRPKGHLGRVTFTLHIIFFGPFFGPSKWFTRSMGKGKIIVEFFSAEIEFSV